LIKRRKGGRKEGRKGGRERGREGDEIPNFKNFIVYGDLKIVI
jgi:hypothetical protein